MAMTKEEYKRHQIIADSRRIQRYVFFVCDEGIKRPNERLSKF